MLMLAWAHRRSSGRIADAAAATATSTGSASQKKAWRPPGIRLIRPSWMIMYTRHWTILAGSRQGTLSAAACASVADLSDLQPAQHLDSARLPCWLISPDVALDSLKRS